MFHGWMFDPDGDQTAAESTRSSTTLDTGSLVNPRTARRLVTASYTSMIAYLAPAIGMPVMKHSRTNAKSLVVIVTSLLWLVDIRDQAFVCERRSHSSRPIWPRR